MNAQSLEPQVAAREAHHRFLNTLTALHGLVRRDFAPFSDPAVREAVARLESRLHVFAAVHRSLQADLGDQEVDVPSHFGALSDQLCALHLAPRGLHCEFRADAGTLSADACQKLGLILVELITNAAKHAFPGRKSGRVSVTFRRTEGVWICVVADNGCGIQAEHHGSGAGLTQSLARALGAELQVHSDAGGVITALLLPVRDRPWREPHGSGPPEICAGRQ